MTNKDHPFGRLLRKHLRQNDNLNLSRLAEGIHVDPSVITRMCQGKRLSDRKRILEIIGWLHSHKVLTHEEEATALLEAANHAKLNANQLHELPIRLQGRGIHQQAFEPTCTNSWTGVIDVNSKGMAVIKGYDLWFTSFAQKRWKIYRLDGQSGNISPFHFKREALALDQFVPSISPDGTEIAFSAGSCSDPHSCSRNVYIADLDGTHVRQLTHSKLDVYHPSWSPDGKWLAYSAQSYQGSGNQKKYGIWVMDLRSTPPQPHQLTNEGDYDPVWSPNGQYIAYHSMDASWSIKILDFQTYRSAVNSCATWIAADIGTYATSPGWINDYKIVFTSDRDNSWDIYELPVKPNHEYSNPTKLTTNHWDNLYPAVFTQKILLWQAFQHEEKGDEGVSTHKDAVIYVMNLDSGEEIPLITGIGNSRDGFLSPKT